MTRTRSPGNSSSALLSSPVIPPFLNSSIRIEIDLEFSHSERTPVTPTRRLLLVHYRRRVRFAKQFPDFDPRRVGQPSNRCIRNPIAPHKPADEGNHQWTRKNKSDDYSNE